MPERFTLDKSAPPTKPIEDYGLDAPALTREEHLRLLEEYRQRRNDHAEIFEADFTNNENTKQLLSELPPDSIVRVDKRDFHFSKVFQTGRRKHAVGYTVLEDGVVAPRLFYKSNSDGFWRVSPSIDVELDDEGVEHQYYSKGETMDTGYVRETRLHDALAEHLEEKEAAAVSVSPDFIQKVRSRFSPENLGITFTYRQEAFGIKLKALKDFFVFTPGTGFVNEADARPAREVLEELRVVPQLKADFTQEPQKIVKRTHAMLGDVTIESYPSSDGRFLWNMARTTNGIVWVNGITSSKDREGSISSYGTDHEVVLAGVLDNKPIEYISQLQGLEEGIDYIRIPGTSYAQLTVLDKLEPIREYKKAHTEYAPAA